MYTHIPVYHRVPNYCSISICIYIHVCMYVCMYVYVHMCIYIYTLMCAYIYTYIRRVKEGVSVRQSEQ